MRRAGLVCGLLAVFCLAGCGSRALTAEEPAFYVELINNCDGDVFSVVYEYGLEDESLGGGGACATRGPALPQGGSLRIDFTPGNFPDGTQELSEFTMKLSVCAEEGGELTAATPQIELSLRYGGCYVCALTRQNGEFHLETDMSA